MALMLALVQPARAVHAAPAVPVRSEMPAGQGPWDFDIPSLPLHQALQRYAAYTGRSVLYTAASAQGRRSAPVVGRYGADQALLQLLKGSGLTVRHATPHAVSLAPVRAGQASLTPGATPPSAPPAQRAAYYGRLRLSVLQMLCADERIDVGSYRLVLQFRITQARAIDVQSVVAVDALAQEPYVRAALTGQLLPAPPAGLGQPVTMLLTPQAGGRRALCA
ncbi:STN domain-containing protein [Orrella sp. JC864]|uniref:STN domain-containing protein n=1 Tax=Orrella sp. JC864 TaxID=3120298 RepID=UPI0012BCF4A9